MKWTLLFRFITTSETDIVIIHGLRVIEAPAQKRVRRLDSSK